MTRQEFVDLIRSHRYVATQREALPCALDQVLLADAQPECDAAEWRRRRMNAFLAAQDHVLSLMLEDLEPAVGPGRSDASPHDDDCVLALDPLTLAQHRVRLVRLGTAHWLTRLDEFRNEHRARVDRRAYDDAHGGAPPFRDADHGALDILSVNDWSLPDPQGKRRSVDAVAAFLGISSSHRAEFCRERLLIRTMTEADLKSAQERDLAGQRGLFARVPMAAGTCLGVYGGQLMDDVDQFILRDDRYLMALRTGPSRNGMPRRVAVNGEGALSLMNTLFDYDKAGRPTGQAHHGYNVERVLYPARLAHGWHIAIPAAFTSTAVRAGDELRFNYELAPTS